MRFFLCRPDVARLQQEALPDLNMGSPVVTSGVFRVLSV